MNKTILGLDLGTNSIGWALLEQNFEEKSGKILGMGSRIIPMTQDVMDKFGAGAPTETQTAARTGYRGVRRLRERYLLRRERLHRVLNVIGFLPEHYASEIDFEKHFGKFKAETEPKLPWKKSDDGKFSFLFQNSFNEMLTDFKANGQELKIPYDWTIYYLRKKALSQKIEKEELSWILLNFNQKRGYYQLRGEEEEVNPNKLVEFYSLKILDVLEDAPQKEKADIWYSLVLENGWVYRRASKTPLFDWKYKTRDFIVTTDLSDDGSVKTDKEGNEKRSFRAPAETDWTLVKKKTEQEIDQSHKTVGTYIYETLLQNPKQKIKGKLVRTIERKFYKEELKQILAQQKMFHPELQSEDLYNECVREIYRNNEGRQQTLSKKDFVHLLMEDILFYQRPLRSQKSSISNCTLEYRKYKDKDGLEHTEYLKAIPKSNPYYQEFRIWQWMYNLNIYKKDDDVNVTSEFLNSIEDFENLFDFLDQRKEIEQKPLLKFMLEQKGFKGKILNAEMEKYRWNYVEEKKYPGNETKTMISSNLDKVENISADFLTGEIEQKIWHIIYSVNDKSEYEKALKSFARKNNLDENSFFEAFRKAMIKENSYGSFSEKAIKKLLPLMRLGKYWSWENVDKKSNDRISKIITGEYDENIKNKVREKAIRLTSKNNFQGLQLWLAQYIVYGRHSEAAMAGKWNTAEDLTDFLKEFKQNSLRNPIVEQVVTETLRVVKDIWRKYGRGVKDFFSEIHIELGREMKNTADDRKKIAQAVTENENTNLRIKALLAEMMNDNDVENVRPFSPMQQEILKIYEDGVLNSDIEIEDDILKISKTAQPSSSDLKRYKLWLEQKYRSPYTGALIPLNKLFTNEYEIEHIIPQSRYFDDSFSNKVICEAAVNKLKDNYIGLGFIKQFGGTIVECGMDKTVTVFKQDAYEEFVKNHYAKSRSKRTKLMLEDIPEKMIERQMNDTRYISKYISGVLSNIVRAEDGSDEGVNSKNIIPGNGKITTKLKQDWGLNHVWNELILPRFERMQKMRSAKDIADGISYLALNKNNKPIPELQPISLLKGFSKKRIDHRHHAIDALVIACATRDHINLLNNESALPKKNKTKEDQKKLRYDLQYKLRLTQKWTDKEGKVKDKFTEFKKPWESFTTEAKTSLENIVVSFKQNLRIVNKATNYYKTIEDGKKVDKKQGGINWAIRKPLHKETISGKVDLSWIKVPKGKILTATRKPLDTSFDLETIGSITDTGIQKILKNYLAEKGSTELAFSPEGIEDLNKNITRYNEGKPHQPIKKIRIFELGSKFSLGQSGNKKDKYVEAAKGTNLFFAVYEDKNGKRNFNSVPLNEVIERQKQGLGAVPLENEKGDGLLFHLSPNDLVYVPMEDELNNSDQIDVNNLKKEQRKRIYKFVSCTGGEGHLIPQSNAFEIVKNENGTNSKSERLQDFKDGNCGFDKNGRPLMIKEVCIKLNVDRLGNISKA